MSVQDKSVTTTARWMSIAYDNNKFYAIGLDTGKLSIIQ